MKKAKAKAVKIGNREIGYNLPPFVIAEIGINHNGSVEIAKRLIDAASGAGCDAVKFQKRSIDVVYTKEELARPRPIDQSLITTARLRQKKYGYDILDKKAWARLNKDPEDTTNGDLKRILEFGAPEYKEIDAYCKEKGILWFASPWDEESVDFLEAFKPPAYKVASASLTDDGLLKHIRSKGRPVILSTGAATLPMIKRAVAILGKKNLVILQCTAAYPKIESVQSLAALNLECIPTLQKNFPGVPVGFSGNDSGSVMTFAATVLGALMIEKHLTLDRGMLFSHHAS